MSVKLSKFVPSEAVRNRLRKVLRYHKRVFYRELTKSGGVHYIHRHPEVFNIGDYLCSPRHYFKFISPRNGLNVVGGGIYEDRDLALLHYLGFNLSNIVLWGAGETNQKDVTFQGKFHEKLLIWSRRDVDRVRDVRSFVPCVSCFLPFLEDGSTSQNTLLFLNYDPGVTHPSFREKCEAIATDRGWEMLWNNCSPHELAAAYRSSANIITNSFHASYWGLLSGKGVTILGYSSKFKSLLKAFNMDEYPMIQYPKGDGGSLLASIQSIESEEHMVRLEDSRDWLLKFRNINLSFARECRELCAFRDFEVAVSAEVK